MTTALIFALVWGVFWASFLQFTRAGQWLAIRRTWITVVVGVGVDLGIMVLVLDWHTWWRVVSIITVSSLPIIARSLFNEWAED